MNKWNNSLNRSWRITIRLTDFVSVGICILIYIACSELFYRQTIMYKGAYLSDTITYVSFAKSQSDLRAVLWIFNKLYSINESTFEIALYMGAVIIGIIFVNYILINYLFKKAEINIVRYKRYILSLCMLFLGPIYFPGIYEYFYKDTWSNFAWHSPTQQLMTFFGLISILLFLKIYENYSKHIGLLNWGGPCDSVFPFGLGKT